MPGWISESKSKYQRPRLQAILEGSTLDDDELRRFYADFEESEQRGQDYSERDGFSLSQMFTLERSLYVFYDLVWRRLNPSATACVWDTGTSKLISRPLTAYLAYRITKVVGRSSNGLVSAGTLRRWARDVLRLAGFYIRGPGSTDHNRNPCAVTGVLLDKSDSLYNLIYVQWCGATIIDLKLCRNQPKHEYWGPLEAKLIIRRYEAKMIMEPRMSASLLQSKSVVQLQLATAARMGAISANRPNFASKRDSHMVQSNFSFVQTKRHHYSTIVHFEHLKGFAGTLQNKAELRQTIPSVRKACNLTLELASTLIPLFVHRKALYALDTSGNEIVFEDIESFLKSESRHFYVLQDGKAFLRKHGKAHSITDEVLAGSHASKKIGEIGYEVWLPFARSHNFRRYDGDISRIAFGKEGQQGLLNHGYSKDVGWSTYSKGVENYPLQRLVYNELGKEFADLQTKLDQSGHTARRDDCRAVHAILCIVRNGFRTKATAVQPTADQMEEILNNKTKGYHRIKDELHRLLSDPATEKSDRAKALTKQIRTMRDAARDRAMCHNRLLSRRTEHGVVAGDMHEFAQAVKALGNLDNALPLLMTAKSVTDAQEDIASFWDDQVRNLPRAADRGQAMDQVIEEENELLPLDELESEDVVFGDDTLPKHDTPSANPVLVRAAKAQSRSQPGQSSSRAESSNGQKDSAESNAGMNDDADGVEDEPDAETDAYFDSDDRHWSDATDADGFTDPILLGTIRADYMRAIASALPSAGVRAAVNSFLAQNGWCPFCPLDEAGLCSFRWGPSSLGKMTPRLDRTPVGTSSTTRGQTQHMAACHPELLEAYESCIYIPGVADTSVKNFSMEQEQSIREFLEWRDQQFVQLPEEWEAVTDEDMGEVHELMMDIDRWTVPVGSLPSSAFRSM